MLVEVRPLPEKKWHGKKGKESFSQPKAIEVLYDNETGKYATGLTPEEEVKYSELLGKVDLTATFNAAEPHSYWSTKAATIMLQNNTMIFNTDKPIDYVRIKNLKASKLVANSMKEYEAGMWPDATHVIYDETEEINMKASKIALSDDATILKAKMSSEDKANIVQIMTNKSVKGRSEDFINVEIKELIDTKPAEFIRVASLGREEVYTRSAVLEALAKGTLTKEGNSVFYMGDLIGLDYEAAVAWFKDPNNQKMKVSILEKLNSK